MKTIKEIYRIGHGPSSSHTMAPRFASEQFLARHPEAARFEVTLYGSPSSLRHIVHSPDDAVEVDGLAIIVDECVSK